MMASSATIAASLHKLQPDNRVLQIAFNGLKKLPYSANIFIVQSLRRLSHAALRRIDAVQRLAQYHHQALEERLGGTCCMLRVLVGVLHKSWWAALSIEIARASSLSRPTSRGIDDCQSTPRYRSQLYGLALIPCP